MHFTYISHVQLIDIFFVEKKSHDSSVVTSCNDGNFYNTHTHTFERDMISATIKTEQHLYILINIDK